MKKTGYDAVKETAPLFEGHVISTGIQKDGTRTVTVARQRPYEMRKAGVYVAGVGAPEGRRYKVEIEGYSEPPGQAAAFLDYLEEEKGLAFAKPGLVWGRPEYEALVKKERSRRTWSFAGNVSVSERAVAVTQDVDEYFDQEVWRVTVFLKPDEAAERADPAVQALIDLTLKSGSWKDAVSVGEVIASQVYRPGDRVLVLGKKPPLVQHSKYYFVTAYRSRIGQAMYRLMRFDARTGKCNLSTAVNIRLYVGE